MAIVKAQPVFSGVRRDMDRFFDRLFEPRLPGFEATPIEATWMPSLDFSENDKEYLVRIEVAEIPKENLDVTLDGNVLTISGHRETSDERKTERYIWREREEGTFQRSVRIPHAVMDADINAVCNDGVLTVRIPKASKEVASKILIK